MDKGTLILLVDESSTGIDSIRRVLADRAHHFRVQRVADVPTALARILGGGVDIVLLNLPAAAGPESERLLPFLELRNQGQAVPDPVANTVPIVVLCGSADESLAEAADYVLVDAPVSLSAGNRAAIEDAALLVLVVERDSLAVDAARLLLRAIDAWKAGRVSLGAVVVNRAALVYPVPLADIEVQLAIPILGVIPPAADVCAAAQQAHSPLLALDTDNLLAIAMRTLSRAISHQVPLPLRPAALNAASPAHPPAQVLHRVGVR